MLDSETKLLKKPIEVYVNPCSKCGGRVIRADVIARPNTATAKCEDCGHGVILIAAETATAVIKQQGR